LNRHALGCAAVSQRFRAIYRVRADARRIEARANEIAIEQSVETPLAAIDDAFVRADIVGRVETIEAVGAGLFDVRIALATATVGGDPGQLLNMLFGNTSLQDDTTLQDVELPAELVALFGGPRHGVAGLRARVQAGRRALTCAAVKPQGLSPVELAALARRFAQGGIDCIKDDHGIADQACSPFAARVEAVAAAVREVAEAEGRPIVYAPSLSGDLDRLRAQVAQARSAGLTAVLVAPLIVGLSSFHRLVAENRDIAFLAHPSMGGAACIAPALLFGKLFRLFGADAFIFPGVLAIAHKPAATSRTPGVSIGKDSVRACLCPRAA
jgi:ribulose-bisphosphate carboxylase large chain